MAWLTKAEGKQRKKLYRE